MYVIPQADRLVPDPAKGDDLPKIGRKVEPDIYWHRRVKDHDVTVISDAEGAALQEKEEQRQLAEAKAKAEEEQRKQAAVKTEKKADKEPK